MINPNAAVALTLSLLALSGCDSTDWGKYMAILSGQVDSLTDQQSDLLTRISALQADDDTDEADRVAREAEIEALRRELSELGNKLSSIGYEPLPEPPVMAPEASSEPNGPAYNTWGYTGPLPCPGSVYGLLTCDDNGQDWHWLKPGTMEWGT